MTYHFAINRGEQLKDVQSKQVIIGDTSQNDHGVVRAMRANKCKTKTLKV